MQELVSKLMDRADLSEEQAKQAVDVVAGFLEDRLPDAVAGPVLGQLRGDDAADKLQQGVEGAKDQLGKLFGG